MTVSSDDKAVKPSTSSELAGSRVLLISYASSPAAYRPSHSQGQGNLINTKDHLISGSTHLSHWTAGSRELLRRQWSAESKAIHADHVIICGSYDRCLIDRCPRALTQSASFIIQQRYICILYWIASEWDWCPCFARPPNENVQLFSVSVRTFLCPIRCYIIVFPWLSGVCTVALHLSLCEHLHFMFLSLLVISISGICLMAWDSLVNRSHDKQPLFAQPLDYVFTEQCISVRQYVTSACVELCWRLWTFNKNSIKNDAGHGAEGRAAKSPLKRIQIHPCARLSSHHENTIMFSHWILWLRITTRQIGKYNNRQQTQLL